MQKPQTDETIPSRINGLKWQFIQKKPRMHTIDFFVLNGYTWSSDFNYLERGNHIISVQELNRIYKYGKKNIIAKRN